jgi:glucan phosphorylase
MLSNPGFAELATERIGDAWTRDHDALRALEPLAQDAGFREDWRRMRRAAKSCGSARSSGVGPASSSTSIRCSTCR